MASPELLKYKDFHCPSCMKRQVTIRFCQDCGLDLCNFAVNGHCVHCGHKAELSSEVTDKFCRACGKTAQFRYDHV